MRKEQLIELVQKEIAACTESLTQDNLSQMIQTIQSQLEILKAIDQAIFNENVVEPSESTDELVEEATEAVAEEVVEEVVEEILATPSEQTVAVDTAELRPAIIRTEKVLDEGKIIEGFFQQKIRGGTVHKREAIYVPEKIIRELDLKTGDFVRAEMQENHFSVNHFNFETNKRRKEYKFALVARTENEAEEVRKIESMVAIKKHTDLNRFYLEFMTEDSEVPVSALITDNDISRFRLAEGDIVDYAHELHNPISGYVIWKHRIDVAVPRHPQKKSPKNNQPSRDAEDKAVRKKQPLFQDLSVLVIGGRNSHLHKAAKEEIEMRKGVFHSLSGDEKRPTIVSRIKKADLVIVFTQSISHDAMYLAKDVCKKYNKVCSYTKDIGATSLVRKLSIMKKKLPES